MKLTGDLYLVMEVEGAEEGDLVPSEEEEEETVGDLVKVGAWAGPGGSSLV